MGRGLGKKESETVIDMTVTIETIRNGALEYLHGQVVTSIKEITKRI